LLIYARVHERPAADLDGVAWFLLLSVEVDVGRNQRLSKERGAAGRRDVRLFGSSDIDSVPDSRGVTINIHYSISELTQTSYKPRLADDRIGYSLQCARTTRKRTSKTVRALHHALEFGEG